MRAPVFSHNQIDGTLRDWETGEPIANQASYEGPAVVYDNHFSGGRGLFQTWTEVEADGVVQRNWKTIQ